MVYMSVGVLTGCSSLSRMAKKRMKMRAVDLDMVYLGGVTETVVEMGPLHTHTYQASFPGVQAPGNEANTPQSLVYSPLRDSVG